MPIDEAGQSARRRYFSTQVMDDVPRNPTEPTMKFLVPKFWVFFVLAIVGVGHPSSSAIVTNGMPPGGVGPASVALGVSVPGGIASLEVNPALLAWEGNRTSSLIQYSSFQSELLPFLKKNHPSESVNALGLRFPLKSGTDVALGYSNHRVDFGTSTKVSPEGDSIGETHGDEQIHHLALSARFAGMISLGVGWKYMDSRLVPEGMYDSKGQFVRGTASSMDWDLGVRIAPQWRIPYTPLRVLPALGVAWINLIHDSVDYGGRIYTDSGTFLAKDAVGQYHRWGTSVSLIFPDVASVDLFLDDEVDVADRYASSAVRYQGWSLDLLGIFRWSSADLIDSDGRRSETQESMQYTFDLKQLYRLLGRWESNDWTSLGQETPANYPLPQWKFLGATLSPNLRLSYTKSKIRGWDYYGAASVRDGQKRIGWEIAL